MVNSPIDGDENATHDDTNALHSSTIRLLASILKIARDDWGALNDDPKIKTSDGRTYVDREHRVICERNNFLDGREELESFFHSGWFDKICAEIGFSPDEVRHVLTGETTLLDDS